MNLRPGEKKRYAVLYATLFFCAALIAAYLTVITITSRYHKHIQMVQQDLLIQIELERRVRDTAGILSELADSYALSKRYFRTPDDIIEVIEELEGLGSVVGAPVSVLQVQVEREDEETREGLLVVNVLSEGSWTEIAHLLSLLDTLPYHSVVNRVTLDTSGIDENTPTAGWSLRATLTIELKNLEA